jgi:hypothetical protein
VRVGIVLILFLELLGAVSTFEGSITPSKVYRKVMHLQQEVELIKKHLGLKHQAKYVDIKTSLLPRHTWQKCYEIFVKINIFREKLKLPIVSPVNMEPTLKLDPAFTYEQILRLDQEMRILKLRLGIEKEVLPTPFEAYKTPTDVYNLLNRISREFDLINAKEFSPSYVFSEAIRIYEDFDAIFTKLQLNDQITPPMKNPKHTPKESYAIALELLESIKKIESRAGLPSIDFYAFRRKRVTPGDVFEITQIILAELQVYKAYLGLRHEITRGAKRYSDKTPADVAQMMGWMLKKSHHILREIH